MPGDQGQVDFGNDGVFVADDAGKQLLARVEHAQEIVADLLFDRLGNPAAGTQVFEGGRPALWRSHLLRFSRLFNAPTGLEPVTGGLEGQVYPGSKNPETPAIL